MSRFVSRRLVWAVFALVAAAGVAEAQRDPPPFDPGESPPPAMAFRPGSATELLFLTGGEDGGRVVVAGLTPAMKLVALTRLPGTFAAAVFLDRERILTGGNDGNLTLWSREGRKLGAFAARGTPVRGLAVSPSGRFVAVRHAKGPIRLYTSDGRPHGAPLKLVPEKRGDRDCDDEFGGRSIVFSADSTRFAASNVCADLVVADVSGRPLARVAAESSGLVWGYAFARDGRTILARWWGMPGGGADFYAIEDGRLGAPRKVPGPFSHQEPADAVTLPSGAGFLLATADRLRFVAADGRALRRDIDIERPIRIAVSDSGERIAVLAAEGVVLFDAGGKRVVDRPFAEFGKPADAELLADGESFASLSKHGLLRFWRRDGTEARSPVAVWDHDARPFWTASIRLAVSPDRKTLAVVPGDRTVRLYDNAGEPRGPPIRIAGDEEDAAIEDGAVALHNDRILVPAREGTSLVLMSLDGATLAANLAPHRNRIKAAAFAPDAQRFATFDDGGVVRLWSIDGKLLKEKRPRLLRQSYHRLAFAPGRETLALYAVLDPPNFAEGFVLWHFGAEDRVEHRASQFLRFLPDGALARYGDNLLVVDAPDGAERHFDSLPGGGTVYLVFDDAAAAIVARSGVARVHKLERRR